MNKYSLSLVTAILISVSSSTVCNGQEEVLATEKFHLSIEGGLNISSLPGLAQGKPVYGFNFGLGTFIKLNDQWALTPELKPLSSRGAKDVINILPNDVSLQNPKTDFTTNYIDVPLLVRFKISNSFFIAAGPQISFLTSALQKTTGTTTSGQEATVTQDMKSLMHKESFMVPVEIGYSLSRERGGKDIDFKVRYNIGVMEAFTATSLATSKNSTLQFILAFPFIRERQTPLKMSDAP